MRHGYWMIGVVFMIGLLAGMAWLVQADEPSKPADTGAQVLAALDTMYRQFADEQLLSNREAKAPMAQLEAIGWELRILSKQYVEKRQLADLTERRLAIEQDKGQQYVRLIGELQTKLKATEEALKDATKHSAKPADTPTAAKQDSEK